MPYTLSMVFIETPVFTRRIHTYISDEEYTGLQLLLMAQPAAGPVVPGSGGVRKLRWALPGGGKRGGIRVIYYWQRAEDEIWLLTVYAKNEESNIPGHILRQIREEFERD